MSENLPPALIAEIVRRLALAFPLPSNLRRYGPAKPVSSDDVAWALGIDNSAENDEVGFLVRMGALKADDDGHVAPAELLRFLEEHGETWVLARLEMMRAELRKVEAGTTESSDED